MSEFTKTCKWELETPMIEIVSGAEASTLSKVLSAINGMVLDEGGGSGDCRVVVNTRGNIVVGWGKRIEDKKNNVKKNGEKENVERN